MTIVGHVDAMLALAHKCSNLKTVDMKALSMLCLVVMMQLSGCVVTRPHDHGSNQSDLKASLAPRIEKRIVECTLPYMSANGSAGSDISYRYRNGSISFQTSDAALATMLKQCADVESGPDIAFEGKIQIWPADAT